ncbi:MAG TPA: hypothetical protein VFF65_07640 [Phycisphaerales bacterium]|nr:hypothetical protein [Phycisphaerales bacterium]
MSKPPASNPADLLTPEAIASLRDALVKPTVEAGVQNPMTLILLVLAVIVVVIFLAVAIVGVPAMIKWRRESREDRRQEQEFQLQKLDKEQACEDTRMQTATQMAAATGHIASTAESLERTQAAAVHILGEAKKHVEALSALGALRKCNAPKQE